MAKKNQKIKKQLSGNISIQTGLRKRKRKKKFVLNSVPIRPGISNSQKKSKKSQKIISPLPG